MTLTEISNLRLISQKIATPEFKTATEVVSRMGAIQAQDFLMSKWAIGVRLSDPAVDIVESSINKGEIVRIHVLRPTWHLISSADIHWMMMLSTQKIKSSFKARYKELDLTESVISKTQAIIVRKLSNGFNLTREELADEFTKSKIRTDANRLSHILFCAELDGLVCSGPIKKNKITYALLHEWVPKKTDLTRDEALAELAKRYFLSRFPATLEDFTWWSNLSATDSRRALDFVKSGFYSETIGAQKYWFPGSINGEISINESVYLLPAYDEFLISYRDRSSSLSLVNNKRTVSDNGIFYPTIVVNGQVAGIWKRTVQKDKVIIRTDFFQSPGKVVRKMAEKKAELFGKFLNKEAEVRNEDDLSVS